ncbi:MAG TPA: endo-1,4-beta-xylanase [Terriglobales bacterium]|nr:endo-1,4-beta-xylanase [Terriglobales bacterium]
MIRNLIALFMLIGLVLPVAAQPASTQPQSLKNAYKDRFVVGAAINLAQIFAQDDRGTPIIAAQFNSITPENILKWALVHPQPDHYDFAPADRFVEYGLKHKMFIVGHCLVWHNQTPKWVFQDEKGNPLTRDTLLKRMHDHIATVVGRYKGKINSWDVVNEALNEDGTMRQTPWLKIIGDDYIEKAFEYAHEADPKAELYYNDFSLENEPKRNGAIALIKRLQTEGIPIAGVGLQNHDNLEWPTAEQEDSTISAFEKLGLKVSISELDITVLPSPNKQGTAEVTATAEARQALNPYPHGLPDAVQQQLTKRYSELFGVFAKHSKIERVTFWGVTDGDSWLNDWPVRGRTNYPLLFDRNGTPKPAFEAVIEAAQNK